MANQNKKRITIYLDLNIESDKIIWDFFEGKRKNETIRPILYNYINGTTNVINTNSDNKNDVGNDISKDEINDILVI